MELIDTVNILGAPINDTRNECVDVVVTLKDHRRFYATFATQQYIDALFKKNRGTGENLSGLYVWIANLIVLEAITHENITSVVRHLWGEGLLSTSFGELESGLTHE